MTTLQADTDIETTSRLTPRPGPADSGAMKRLYARHRLDIRPADLVRALASLPATGQERTAADVERMWSADGLACYSVRSGFHLLLKALALPRGSEVLFSAVTHPDMPRLAQHHGLVPVPIDLEPATLAPRPELVLRAMTDRTRMLVVAHLFGGRVDLAPLAEICRLNGILLVEDCAQAFQGPAGAGDSLADVSMFSFGILKTATALGGAMLTVRNPQLLRRMRSIHLRWSVQKRIAHLKRIVQTAVFVALTKPAPYALLARLAFALEIDFDRLVNSSARAFPAGATDDLVRRLEQRPSAPLMKFLARRFNTFDHARLLKRAVAGEELAAMLPTGVHVGGLALDHTHWLFPIVAERPDETIEMARAEGFDAARAASSVKSISAPAHRPDLEPVFAQEVMSRLVFLPAYPELPAGSLERVASAVEGHHVNAYVTR
ncbi:MAG: DegT/DnrJ/EryC1/StrS aminotransferase family protein [Chloroflexi bacterium]|nr:MAG: DegT/DnrJ/EryC1/StrS aminotransferase family protein [Chloroflexota bacterium]